MLAALPASASAQTAGAGQLVISELRLHGPGGPNDEYVEIYNASGADHTVTAASGGGYAVAASDGATRCTVLNGTIIPNRGHYLCVNLAGYSISGYPGAEGFPANGDAAIGSAIPSSAGIALFNNNSGGASYSLANRIDAVGPATEADTLYREGAGYTSFLAPVVNYALVRRPNAFPNFPTPRDTDSNGSDFRVVSVDAHASIPFASLGAPGPENLSSPLSGFGTFGVDPVSSCTGVTLNDPPNRIRTGSGGNGTLAIRRKLTNQTGGSITRLRARINDITTVPAPNPAIADLRATSSSTSTVTEPCSGNPVTIQGLTLETPPAQANGGGYNSSLSLEAVSNSTPIANAGTIYVEFLLNISDAGDFYGLCATLETLPGGGAVVGETGYLGPAGGITSQKCPGSDPAPTNDAAPSITGSAAVGQTLSGNDGTWTGTDLVMFRQWRRCDGAGGNCQDITGANGQTYDVVGSDIGSTFRLRVKAGNSGGTVPADSPATATVPDPSAIVPDPVVGPNPVVVPNPIVPAPPFIPGAQFGLGRFSAARDGTGVLRVTVPSAGSVAVRDVARRARVKRVTKSSAGPGSLALRVRPTRAGLRTLRANRRMRTTLRVTFTPQGGSPESRTKTVTLKLAPRR